MTTKTHTPTDLRAARHGMETILADAAMTIWEDIAASIEEHGPQQTIDFLKGHVAPHFRHHRISSRSTSIIDNLLDDMKFGIYTGAIFVIEEETRLVEKFTPADAEGEDIAAQVAKEVRSAGRRASANM
jgi:hypothetical protein